MNTSTTRTPFMRFASAVADFGDPFYAEERQRDVWNEASAFGFQFLLWGGLTLSAAMLWIGGHASLPYVESLLIMVGLGSAMTIGYARRLGVTAWGNPSVNRTRYVLLGLVLLALLVGLVRAVLSETGGSADASTLAGAAVGAGTVILFAALIAWRARRRGQQHAADDSLD